MFKSAGRLQAAIEAGRPGDNDILVGLLHIARNALARLVRDAQDAQSDMPLEDTMNVYGLTAEHVGFTPNILFLRGRNKKG
jgi:hypothetical protein